MTVAAVLIRHRNDAPDTALTGGNRSDTPQIGMPPTLADSDVTPPRCIADVREQASR